MVCLAIKWGQQATSTVRSCTDKYFLSTKEHKFSKNANVLNQVKIKFMHKLRDSKLTLSPLYFNKPPISYLITI